MRLPNLTIKLNKMIIALLFSLVIWALIFYIIWWGLGQIAIPEPFNKVVTVIVVLAVIIVIIGLLMGSIPPFAFLSSTFGVR
jgi:uncharacterized membrane protein